MAGQTNPLKPLFKDIADAIREKDGTTALIPHASDFPARIRAIETGGVPEGLRTISVAADPPEGGTVSGGGMASDGMTVTVGAEVAASGKFSFIGWQENGGTVSDNAEYTFPVTGNRDLTAVFNEKSSRLPEGYQEVQYIKTDAKCRIPLNYSANFANTRILYDIKPLIYEGKGFIISSANANNKYFYFARTATNKVEYKFANQYSYISFDAEIADKRTVFDFNFPEKKLSIGQMSETLTLNQNTSEPLYIGNPSYDCISCDIYSLQTFDSGILTHDFVPCVEKSGDVGLYDIVSDVFVSNTGTGILTAGPAV